MFRRKVCAHDDEGVDDKAQPNTPHACDDLVCARARAAKARNICPVVPAGNARPPVVLTQTQRDSRDLRVPRADDRAAARLALSGTALKENDHCTFVAADSARVRTPGSTDLPACQQRPTSC